MRFTTHIKPILRQIRLLTGLNISGKTRNIAFLLVLQQCFKTSCSFFVACFSVPYAAFTLGVRARRSLETNVNTRFFQAPILVHGCCASARLQGRELALGLKSGHRIPVYTVFVRTEAIHCSTSLKMASDNAKWSNYVHSHK